MRFKSPDQYKTGDEVSVDFNLRGREWNGPQGIKYFNTLDAWKIEKLSGSVENTASVKEDSIGDVTSFTADNGGSDDLPF